MVQNHPTVELLMTILAMFVMESSLYAQYSGTASVSQGQASVSQRDIYVCPKGRVTNVGTIVAADGTVWTMPAVVRFTDPSLPTSSDLHNACTGVTYATSMQAVAALSPASIVTVDPDGEVITCFVFADNYFEMYINGVPVGKDNVPYTQFNSSLLQFRVKRPFTIAIHAVDWEEHLGLGTELSGSPYHAGDGGVVAVFRDESGSIIVTTSKQWKAQTYYTSPIYDLSCPQEVGQARITSSCSTADVADGSNASALHWPLPAEWMKQDFDDAAWPNASEYSNQTVGVDNKPAYTNFTDVFDNSAADATFIWSTNLILDNEVLMRYVVPGSTSLREEGQRDAMHLEIQTSYLSVRTSKEQENVRMTLHTIDGQAITECTESSTGISTSTLGNGVYLVDAATSTLRACWLITVMDGSCTAFHEAHRTRLR